ncbi:MAG: DoxX family protein [Patescibacteria group bacterium]|nr:DoxX family protein [Patescibacteria group bacterium]
MTNLCLCKRTDVMLLIARVIIGGIFIYTGWMKVADMGATIGFFGTLGIPAFLTYIVAYAELIGGVLLVLGFWTCLVAGILAIIMIAATWFMSGKGFAGVSTPIATFAALVALMGSCGGKYSLSCKGGQCASCVSK